MTDLVTGLKLTGTPFCNFYCSNQLSRVSSGSKKQATSGAGKRSPKSQGYKVCHNDEGTDRTQNHPVRPRHTHRSKVRRGRKAHYISLSKLEAHYANAFLNTVQLLSSMLMSKTAKSPINTKSFSVFKWISDFSFHHFAFNRANLKGNTVSCMFSSNSNNLAAWATEPQSYQSLTRLV